MFGLSECTPSCVANFSGTVSSLRLPRAKATAGTNVSSNKSEARRGIEISSFRVTDVSLEGHEWRFPGVHRSPRQSNGVTRTTAGHGYAIVSALTSRIPVTISVSGTRRQARRRIGCGGRFAALQKPALSITSDDHVRNVT